MVLDKPIIVIIGIIVLAILFFLARKKNNDVYSYGKKVANTDFIKNTPYYKSLQRTYKIVNISILLLYIASIILGLVLIARPVIISKKTTETKKRDIIICLDVSGSVIEADLRIIDQYEKVLIPRIKWRENRSSYL